MLADAAQDATELCAALGEVFDAIDHRGSVASEQAFDRSRRDVREDVVVVSRGGDQLEDEGPLFVRRREEREQDQGFAGAGEFVTPPRPDVADWWRFDAVSWHAMQAVARLHALLTLAAPVVAMLVVRGGRPTRSVLGELRTGMPT